MLDKIILVYYVGLGNLSNERADNKIRKFKETCVIDDPNIINLVIPTRNTEVKLECLYKPNLNSNLEEKINELSEKFLTLETLLQGSNKYAEYLCEQLENHVNETENLQQTAFKDFKLLLDYPTEYLLAKFNIQQIQYVTVNSKTFAPVNVVVLNDETIHVFTTLVDLEDFLIDRYLEQNKKLEKTENLA